MTKVRTASRYGARARTLSIASFKRLGSGELTKAACLTPFSSIHTMRTPRSPAVWMEYAHTPSALRMTPQPPYRFQSYVSRRLVG